MCLLCISKELSVQTGEKIALRNKMLQILREKFSYYLRIHGEKSRILLISDGNRCI